MSEILRYGLNGLVATGVHYGVLTFNLKVLGFTSAGLANGIAALFGITCSFFGSRYFVFRKTDVPVLAQALKFSGLYGLIALLHASVLLVWTDWLAFDYRIGFLLATGVQVTLSYLGNKKLVFRKGY